MGARSITSSSSRSRSTASAASYICSYCLPQEPAGQCPVADGRHSGHGGSLPRHGCARSPPFAQGHVKRIMQLLMLRHELMSGNHELMQVLGAHFST